MASNDFQWQAKKVTPKKIAGMHVLDAINTMQAQLTLLRKQLGTSNVNVTQTQPQICDFCGGAHSSGDCQVGNTFLYAQNEQANYITIFKGPTILTPGLEEQSKS